MNTVASRVSIEVAEITIRLRILKVARETIELLVNVCCRDNDPFEDTESCTEALYFCETHLVAEITIRLRILKAHLGKRQKPIACQVAEITIRLRILKVRISSRV